jgi:error-prone DNA polymerase
VTYPHPSLEPILKRTLGVPLFQEQLLRLAMVAAGFTGGQAEELRRAFGFKRSQVRMRDIEQSLRDGMTRNGITGTAQEDIVRSITSFAVYGFPESHAASFASGYAARVPRTYYATFAALINSQPMRFYHVSIVKDAQRHGCDPARQCPTSDWRFDRGERWRTARVAYCVKGLQAQTGETIERAPAPIFASIDDMARRTDATRPVWPVLAEIGALSLAPERRGAAGGGAHSAFSRTAAGRWPGLDASPPPYDSRRRLQADYRGRG